MTLVRQPKTAVFRPISKYEYIVPRLSRCFTDALGRERWSTVDTFLHFQPLLLYFKSK